MQTQLETPDRLVRTVEAAALLGSSPSTLEKMRCWPARALGGEVHVREVLGPGPAHSAKDRSPSVTLSPTARRAFSFIPLRATIGADAAVTSSNGLGCRYFVQSGRRNRPPAPITAPDKHFAIRAGQDGDVSAGALEYADIVSQLVRNDGRYVTMGDTAALS
jgi:hypothetical protein